MKKLLILITALTLSMPAATNVANAAPSQPVLAILDTALDTSLPIFKDKIVQEVCVLDYSSCTNGSKFMEGAGAASMPIEWMKKYSEFQHGTQMASAAVQANPNMKIIFIRIRSHNLINGAPKPFMNETMATALNWVYSNKDKYNIQAVAVSQGVSISTLESSIINNRFTGFQSLETLRKSNKTAALELIRSANYCPSEPNTENSIKNLLSVGIPTFFASGNGRDYKRIDWPSCVSDSVAVGSVDQIGEIASYSNYDKLLDLYAVGYANMYAPGNIATYNVGTSIATQIAASQYIAIKSVKVTYTFTQLYDLIIKTSVVAKSGRVPFGKAINLQGALNG